MVNNDGEQLWRSMMAIGTNDWGGGGGRGDQRFVGTLG